MATGGKYWTLNRRSDWGPSVIEFICIHGIGHYPQSYGESGVHGCDGCCSRQDFPGRDIDKLK